MHRTHHHARRWLPGLNFFLADVRDGLGPFLGVFLLAQGWRLDAQERRRAAQLALSALHLARLQNQLTLHKALGGGWPAS